MPIDLNYLAIIVCAATTFGLGMLWYSDYAFGTIWKKALHVREEFQKGFGMAPSFVLGFVFLLIMAYVLAHYINYMGAVTPSEGAESAFWPWLGFIMPVLAGQVIWEKKSFKVFTIDAGYYLSSLIISGIILAIWQ